MAVILSLSLLLSLAPTANSLESNLRKSARLATVPDPLVVLPSDRSVADKSSDLLNAEALTINGTNRLNLFRSFTVDNTTVFSLQERQPSQFLARHRCESEPTITSAFREIDAKYPSGFTELNVKEAWLAMEPDPFGGCGVGYMFDISSDMKGVQTVSYTGGRGVVCEPVEGRAVQYRAMLQELVNEVKLPDMKFVLNTGDAGRGSPLVFRNEGHPGRELLMLPRAFLDWGAHVAATADKYKQPCRSITQKGVFRGSTTGSKWVWHANNPLPLRDSKGWVPPRYRAAELSKNHPDILDAGFTKVSQGGQYDHLLQDELSRAKLMKGWLSDDQQRCYAAVVVIDGNSQADRLPRQMAYGTAIVNVHSNTEPRNHSPGIGNDEFWYEDLVEGTHYMHTSIGDLEPTLRTLLADKSKIEELGRNSQAFVKERLTRSRFKCYMHQLLSEYGKRYRRS